MNPGGDAAEQVVRLSLEGVEVAAKISGNGAKNIALMLYAALREEQKTKGKTRLTSMLKSGKELKVYTITNKDLKTFSQEAKRYGVLYCVLKDRNNTDPNAAIDILARAEDASKIQRITERFRLMTVDKAEVTTDIMRSREARKKDDNIHADPELNMPAIDEAEVTEGIVLEHAVAREEAAVNPSVAKTGRDPLSEPNSQRTSRSNGSEELSERTSVREKLKAYMAETERERAVGREARSRTKDMPAEAVKKLAKPKEPGRGR